VQPALPVQRRARAWRPALPGAQAARRVSPPAPEGGDGSGSAPLGDSETLVLSGVEASGAV